MLHKYHQKQSNWLTKNHHGLRREDGGTPFSAMKKFLRTHLRNVEQCVIRILTDQTKIQIQLKCKLETVRNAYITFIDEENITATAYPNSTNNVISGTFKIFDEISSNFNTIEEEITLEIQKEHLTVKNYIEGSRVHDKFMRSKLRLDPDEFATYKVGLETAVTFCLKEFRAFLVFAETLNACTVLSFNQSGSPIYMTARKCTQVECVLVMSTLSLEDVSFYRDCRLSEVLEPNISIVQKRTLRGNSTRENVAKASRHMFEVDTLSNDSMLFPFNALHYEAVDSSKSILEARRFNIRGAADINEDNITMILTTGTDSSPTPDVPLLAHAESMIHFYNTEEVNLISQSPQIAPVEQMRSIFLRCFESTYMPEKPSPTGQIFAANSDTED